MGTFNIGKLILLMCFLYFSGSAQSPLQGKKYLEEGNTAYRIGDMEKAKEHWQKAGENMYRPAPLHYNKGNAEYRAENYEGSTQSYKMAIEQTKDKAERARQYHNLGNSYIKSEKTKEAIDAYKNALRNNPHDEETRYNLAYAQNKLKEEEQKEKNKDDKNDEDKNQDKEEKDKNDDKNKKEGDNEKQDKPDENKSQPKPSSISREQALKDLEAVKNDEKKVMEKLMQMNKDKQKKQDIEKDW